MKTFGSLSGKETWGKYILKNRRQSEGYKIKTAWYFCMNVQYSKQNYHMSIKIFFWSLLNFESSFNNSQYKISGGNSMFVKNNIEKMCVLGKSSKMKLVENFTKGDGRTN